jgi:16S rRNA (guanine966-N2)-methyltransferase
MRIVAGQWRGRQLVTPSGERTRPILDRAKTVLFDMLGNLLAQPGSLPPVAVLDLFAGTGTLGLEALSRGARFCRFVEQHRATAALLRKNLDTLGVVHEADVLEADATMCDFAPSPPVADPSEIRRGGPWRAEDGSSQYELVFVDPPYRLVSGRRPVDAIRRLLDRLAQSPAVAPSALIVVRHAVAGRDAPDLSPLIEETRRDVGRTTLRLLRRPDAPSLIEDSP